MHIQCNLLKKIKPNRYFWLKKYNQNKKGPQGAMLGPKIAYVKGQGCTAEGKKMSMLFLRTFQGFNEQPGQPLGMLH